MSVFSEQHVSPRRTALAELMRVFLKLGMIGFGGPAAHVALMDEEIVRRRRWLPREEFLDLLGAASLIPGPNSTELAIHIGRRRAGWPGLLVAGSCFILPAALIVIGVAWVYVRFGSLPQVSGILYGVKPVIIVIVLQALWHLGRAALKNRWLAAVCIAGVALSLLGVHELIILFGGGLLLGAGRRLAACAGKGPFRFRSLAPAMPLHALIRAFAVPTAAAAPFGLWPLFLFFLKVGSVLFGSGYVLLAFLRADLVERWHWLTESQLLDALAVGQVTPGPVFTTATFIGFVLGGIKGSVAATVGIFMPAFLFVALSAPLVSRIRQAKTAGAFLDGVNAASVALMAVVTLQLGRTALVDALTIGIAAASVAALACLRVNSAWLILGGAIAGFLLYGRL